MAIIRLLFGLLAAFHGVTGVVFESVKAPLDWSVASTPTPSENLKLKIALKQQNVQVFEQKLLDMSNPSHSKYGKHLKRHEVKALLNPSKTTVHVVQDWLKKGGISRSVHHDNDWIDFETTVHEANELLNTTFLWFKHKQQGTLSLRTLSYSVPEDVGLHIDLIQPTTRFSSMQPLRSITHKVQQFRKGKQGQSSKSVGNTTCSNVVTPQCLMKLYNVHYKADSCSGSKLGFASFLEQYSRYKDLALFESQVAPYTFGQNFSVVSFNGGLNNQTDRVHSSGEANLDVQYAIAMAYPLPVTEFSVASRGPFIPNLNESLLQDNTNEPYLQYLTELIQLPDDQIPQVLVHSYGEPEQSVPATYNKKICNLFAQLGVRGKSVIFASGDTGVGEFCLANDGSNATRFQPDFPAACPWITSVGGTFGVPERAAAFSSGGFSRIYGRPDYQDEAVSAFLDGLGNKFKGYFNPHGRGFPDVAASSVDFTIFDSGFRSWASGTSAAAPTFAGIIALLNDARLSAGMPPLGFLNPWLYQIGSQAFNDIMTGRNQGCSGASIEGLYNGGPVIPGAGFNATKGWDPVTGLGTPDFGKMLQFAVPGAKNEGGPVP